jgi:sugar (pentulose or hexulose) kinase
VNDPVLIGVDVGTSTIKVGAFDDRGGLLALRRGGTPTTRLGGGLVEHDADALWGTTSSLLRDLVGELGNASRIAGLAVASVGEASLPVDARGRALRPAIAWYDTRAGAEAAWWADQVGPDRINRITGQSLDPHYGVNKLMWVRAHEPAVFRATQHWLSIADFIVLQLTGEVATDPTLASRTLAWDQRTQAWSAELLAEVDLDPRLFPRVAQSGSAVGGVRPEAAGETGLRAGTVVVLGGHDRLCGAYAVRSGSRTLVDSTGSAEAVVMPVGEYVERTAEEAGHVACYADVVPVQYVLSARVGYAGALVDWFRRLVADAPAGGSAEPEEAPPDDLAAVEALTRLIPAPLDLSGLMVYPSFGRVVTPVWDPRTAPGVIHGLTLAHGRGHVFQALLEGICYSLRRNLEWLVELGAAPGGTLRVEGGATRNPVWMQLKADITGLAVEAVALPEPTALGAALLAGIGAGVYADHRAAGHAVKVPFATWLPDAARTARFDRAYRTGYLPLADALIRLARPTGV